MPVEAMPYIDPNVEHVGVSKLRKLNATSLRESRKALVIQENDTPLAVLLDYEQFLFMQQKIEQLLETVELLSDEHERGLLVQGLDELKAGRTRDFSEIRKSLGDPLDDEVTG